MAVGTHDAAPPPDGEAWLVYDGECPFCSAYVRYVRVRESLGRLHLVDAREPGHPVVDEVRARGLDLDDGMVLKLGGHFYHGADCVHVLALLSTASGPFNRLNAAVFRSPAASRRLYPMLRAGRNAVLRLLGRRKLAENVPVGQPPPRRLRRGR
jgi:predicted DCC family thiol-disulfide oxidoreductase YuxK